MTLVLYADFGSPCCYLASHAVDALAAAGVEADWRGVEREPRLNVTPRRVSAAERATVGDELTAVAELVLPDVDLLSAMPDMVPNTAAAVAGYAEAYGAGVDDDVRRLLVTAYWVDHADIGHPEVLRRRLAGPIVRGRAASDPLSRFGFAVSMNRGPITTSAWRRVQDWRGEWERQGTGSLPTLVEDGQAHTGGAAVLQRLARHIARRGAKIDRDLPDPGGYPAVAVRPSKQWTSQVGGPWAYAWMSR